MPGEIGNHLAGLRRRNKRFNDGDGARTPRFVFLLFCFFFKQQLQLEIIARFCFVFFSSFFPLPETGRVKNDTPSRAALMHGRINQAY